MILHSKIVRFALAAIGLIVLGGVTIGLMSEDVPVAAPPEPDPATTPAEVVAAVNRKRDVVLAEPHSASAWGRLGKVLLANKCYHEAVEAFRQAGQLDPTNWHWLYLLGNAEEPSDLPRAIDTYQRTIAVHGDYAPLHVRRGLALEKLERFDEAQACWQQALQLDTSDYDARLGLGRAAQHSGDLSVAKEHLSVAATADPKRREAYLELLQLAARTGDSGAVKEYQEKLTKCSQAPTRPPDPVLEEMRQYNVAMRFQQLAQMADQMRSQKNFGGFIKICAELIDLAPDNPHPMINLGVALNDVGQRDQAIAILEDAVRRHAQAPTAYYNLGVVLAQAGRIPDAIAAFEKAVELKRDYADAFYNLAVCRSQSSDLTGAAAAGRGAISARPDYFDAHFLLGQILQKQGDAPAARSQFVIAARLRPGDTKVSKALAELPSDGSRQPQIAE